MKRFLGGMVSMLCLCLVFAATVHGRSPNTVYLKGGGRIECQNYWKRDGRVVVLVNRDVQIELSPDEVDITRTFSKKRVVPARKVTAAVAEENEAKAADTRTADSPQHTGTASVPEKPKGAPVAKLAVSPAGPAASPQAQTPAKPAAPQPPAPAATAKPVPQNAVPAAAAKPVSQNAVPAAAAKPVSQSAVPAAARSPLQGPVTSARTTLPQVAVKQASPAATVPFAMPGMGTVILFLVIVLFLIVSAWKVFTKAGEAGWQCLIPLWNMFVLVKISGKPWWWFLLLFVPVVNLIVYILVFIALAARFNKGALFGLGLFFLGFIFFPILAFGSSTYE